MTQQQQGKRTDIQVAVDICKETGSIGAVLDKVHNYQAVRHVELYMKYKEPAEQDLIYKLLIYGVSQVKVKHVTYMKMKRTYSDQYALNGGKDMTDIMSCYWTI